MALTNSGDELGKVVRFRQVLELVINGGAAVAIDSITQLISEAEAVFDADATAKRMLPSVLGFLNYWRNTQIALLTMCDALAFKVLNNRTRVDIKSTSLSSNIASLVGDIGDYLRDNTKAVLECTPAVGAVQTGGTNTGTGTLHVDMLDRWNLKNQAIQNCDILAVCTADAITGGCTEHQETFQMQHSFGRVLPGLSVCTIPAADGSGDTGGGNRLQNEDASTPGNGAMNDTTIPFENFTSHLPDGWTLDTGDLATDIKNNTTEYYFGAASLELVGDGATLIELSQDANDFYGATSTDQALDPLAHYHVSFFAKAEDAVTNAGVISLYMDGTAYTAGATEKATLDLSSAVPTSWTLYKGVIRMPKAIPTDMKAVLKCSTAIVNGKSVYVDGACIAKMHHWEFAGVNIAIPAGSTAFVSDEQDPDRLWLTLTNDWAGLFQEFFARRSDPRDMTKMKYADIGVAVRSAASASAELAETKAQ